MRLLSISVLTALLSACGEDPKNPATETTIVDYNKLKTDVQTEQPLTLANQDQLSLHIKNGIRVQLKSGPYYNKDGMLASGGLPPPANTDGAAKPGTNETTTPTADSNSLGFSDTNVHVSGVDESDYAKYDGKHWFVASTANYRDFYIEDGKPGFQIVATDPDTPNVEIVSKVILDSDDEPWGELSEMYLVQENATTSHVATIRNKWGNVYPYLPGISVRMAGGVGIAVDLPATATANAATTPAVNDAMSLRIAPSDGIAPAYLNPQNSKVRIQLTDVQNPSSPKQDWDLLIDGSLIDSRKVGNMLYLLTRYDPWLGGLYYDNNDSKIRAENEKELASAATQQLLPNYQVGNVKQALSESCYLQKSADEYSGYTSLVNITAIDLSKQKLVSSVCINSGLEALSMTATSLYLTGTTYSKDEQQNKTVIHKFVLGENGPEYVATGSASGTLGWSSDVNFRMNEYADTFRIITSDWTENGPKHLLTVLKQDGSVLNTISTLPNKAHPEPIGKPLEEIYSVRFENTKAYIVTFRRTDPLYALDLSDPTDPIIAGELVIPGFATYMHPVGNDFLFTLGHKADTEGRVTGMKAELINVAGSTPEVVSTINFDGNSTNSEALTELKAFSFKRDENRLRIAMPISKYMDSGIWDYEGLQLLEVTNLPTIDVDGTNSPLLSSPKLQNAGVIISQKSNANQAYYSGYGINRSIIHNDAVFYAHNNSFWAAKWNDPKGAVGPIAATAECTEQLSPPALRVNIQLSEDASRNPCDANVIAYNNSTGDQIILQATPLSSDKNACIFSADGPAGEYTVIADLAGYQSQKEWAVVYRNQCHVITQELTMTLRSEDQIICTTEARASLEIYVDVDPSDSASACDASVVATHNGIQYPLNPWPAYEYITYDQGGSVSGGSEGSDASVTVGADGAVSKPAVLGDAALIAPPPPDVAPSTRCIFSGPYELAGKMSVSVSMDGHIPVTIDDIFVERDVCHVQTQQRKAWLDVQPE